MEVTKDFFVRLSDVDSTKDGQKMICDALLKCCENVHWIPSKTQD